MPNSIVVGAQAPTTLTEADSEFIRYTIKRVFTNGKLVSSDHTLIQGVRLQGEEIIWTAQQV